MAKRPWRSAGSGGRWWGHDHGAAHREAWKASWGAKSRPVGHEAEAATSSRRRAPAVEAARRGQRRASNGPARRSSTSSRGSRPRPRTRRSRPTHKEADRLLVEAVNATVHRGQQRAQGPHQPPLPRPCRAALPRARASARRSRGGRCRHASSRSPGCVSFAQRRSDNRRARGPPMRYLPHEVPLAVVSCRKSYGRTGHAPTCDRGHRRPRWTVHCRCREAKVADCEAEGRPATGRRRGTDCRYDAAQTTAAGHPGAGVATPTTWPVAAPCPGLGAGPRSSLRRCAHAVRPGGGGRAGTTQGSERDGC